MVTTIASVNDVADDGKYIIGYTDGDNDTVESQVTDVEPGDLVITDSVRGSRVITEIAKKQGWRHHRSVGVVEEVLEETLVVRTENGVRSIPCNEIDSVEVGNTIELSQANSFCRIISDDPVEITPKPDVEVGTISINLGGEEDAIEEETGKDFRPEQLPEISFADIGGLRRVKERVREAVFIPRERSEEFDELNLDIKRGLLFFGPPGTGKTMVAKAIANELEGFFFSIGGPEIVSKYYGESEQQIRKLFNSAESKAAKEDTTAIVFIDEIDSIVPRRSGADETERRIVAQFLDALDGLEDRGNVVVIGATNRPDAIDPAVRRSGRFGEEVEFELPTAKGRQEILEVILQGKPTSDRVDTADIASRTEGWSGADLQSLVQRAGITAAEDGRTVIDEEDIQIAFERIDSQRKRRQAREQRKEEE
ncbi:26S protease regulatory subunit [Haloarchaeobius sp. HME9146]|uniref:ATP-binding protein n=1 Tax=Haloarchaeobius sp. HME9146 TaxID=2978732 RepID=UPI0021C0C7F8|nr:ATP-binding protein [Haloarchaeobius sp. HME9146]MCT9096971.1 ATP-binding protein [Haloarchaeobius sp. HME9146]